MVTQDKYSAVWVSHSSMGDFLKCPRAYYLHNMYKDPKTRRKITIVNPALSLGTAVHTTLENLKHLPVQERMSRDLLADYEEAWVTIAGKKGGFVTNEEEAATKLRGRAMIERVIENLGPIAKKTVKLKESEGGMPPNFYLSEEDNIILCGLVDWIEYVEEDDSIRILDFKTGKNEENEDSLQLPIYLLLLSTLQKRTVSGALYWYLDKENNPREVELPDLEDARTQVLKVARKVKKARETNTFVCPRGEGGCFACKPFEKIIKGEADYVGVVGFGQDAYRV